MTRDQLLRVAREAFAELGYAGASMGDIAARAGIRKSSLFHHFATKDELYRDALSGVAVDIEEKVRAACVDEGGTALDQMDRANRAVQIYFGEHAVAARMLVREFVDGGTVALGKSAKAVDEVLSSAVNILERSMSDGKLPKQDAKQLTLSIAGVHLLFFAIPTLSSKLIGSDVFGADQVAHRAELVCQHVRRMMGAPVA